MAMASRAHLSLPGRSSSAPGMFWGGAWDTQTEVHWGSLSSEFLTSGSLAPRRLRQKLRTLREGQRLSD